MHENPDGIVARVLIQVHLLLERPANIAATAYPTGTFAKPSVSHIERRLQLCPECTIRMPKLCAFWRSKS